MKTFNQHLLQVKPFPAHQNSHVIYELRREKTGFLHMQKQRHRSASRLRGNREADQRLCFRYTDSTIALLPKSEISSL